MLHKNRLANGGKWLILAEVPAGFVSLLEAAARLANTTRSQLLAELLGRAQKGRS